MRLIEIFVLIMNVDWCIKRGDFFLSLRLWATFEDFVGFNPIYIYIYIYLFIYIIYIIFCEKNISSIVMLRTKRSIYMYTKI